jgi:hypothetical protein
MTARKFILQELCIRIEEICNAGFPYHAFLLEAVAIEFLGKASIYNCDWSDFEKNGLYFKKGLSLLGGHYKKYEDKIYKNLRNGMAHFLGPKPGIGLCSIKNEGVDVTNNHLTFQQNGNLLLVFEVLHSDFKRACLDLLRQIPEDDYGNKINLEFLNI